MSEKTGIEWTDHTFNPWWGCTKVSAGCDHCYADTLSTRYGHNVWGPDAPRRFFGDKHWDEPLNWDTHAEMDGVRRRVFCGSMCDWAEGRPDQAEARRRLFALIEATPHLDWQLLTKRPGAIPHLIPDHWLEKPRHNVWFGTSVENQEQADRRIPQLLNVPAKVRFLSCEPLLGPVDLSPFHIGWSQCRDCCDVFDPNIEYPLGSDRLCTHCYSDLPLVVIGHHLHWVITGGESGAGARPGHPDWYRSLRDQCVTAGVAFNFKQWGEWAPVYTAGDDPDLKGRSVQALLDGTVTDTNWNGGAGPHLIGSQAMWRYGKKKAGRLLGDPEYGSGSLDYKWGREWSEFPVVPPRAAGEAV